MPNTDRHRRSRALRWAHPQVAEAAVVGYPHDLIEQDIYAYVTLEAGIEPSEPFRKELVTWVGKQIGAIASPDLIQWAPSLPKTRSGKIMRRILLKIAANEQEQTNSWAWARQCLVTAPRHRVSSVFVPACAE